MKKKLMLTVVFMVFLTVLSSCAFLTPSRIEQMLATDERTYQDNTTIKQKDNTVTISLDEYEKLLRFKDAVSIYDFIQEYYYKAPDEEKLIDYTCKGLMAGLDDPYSFYYTPEEYKKMWEEDEGNYAGIGVMINANYKTQICTISRVFKGSPAESCGVLRGDILYRVGEDLLVTAENLDEAVKIMRGEPGTSVDVTFLRNDEEITFTINREMIRVNQIESKMLNDQVGYIALYQFAGQCDKDFEVALNGLLKENATGIIIDLRDNGGGWVEQARYIADLFMDGGELCYLVFKDGTEEHNYYITHDGKADVKIVLLVNEMSASSSEILTGALRDCADAIIVGTKTFGKGIVQDVIPVGDRGAGFQLTVAEYFTPHGFAVHETGITPDVIVQLPEEDNGMYDFADLKNDIQLQKALEVAMKQLQ